MLTDTDIYYNAQDVGATMEVALEFWKEVFLGGHEDIYQQTVDLIHPLMYMQARGICVDGEQLAKTKVEIAQEIEEKQNALNEKCGRDINPLSPKDVQTYFYIECGIKPYTSHKTGNITVDDKALARIARGTASRRSYPEAKLIQELRGLHKLKGTYLEIEFDEDGRFRTSCNPRGTKFGRISTGKTIFGTGMNMQNLPPQFKRFLVPDPGYILIEMDKAQAEWVVVAYQTGDANMIQVLEEGGDPHAHTAKLMFGASDELIAREKKLVGHLTDPVEIEEIRREHCPEIYDLPLVIRNCSLRQAGKKSNHALNYDETYKMFSLHNEMPEAESKIICDRYHEVYPGIHSNYELVQNQLRQDRTLTNCFGRKQKFLGQWDRDLWKQAYAFVPQSTVADLINRALIAIYFDGDPEVQGIELLAQVHDSILFQVPCNLGPDAILYCIDKMEFYMNPTMTYGGRDFTIDTDIKAGTVNWNDLPELQLSDRTSLRKTISELCEQETARLSHSVS